MTQAESTTYPHAVLITRDGRMSTQVRDALRRHFGHSCVTTIADTGAAVEAGLRAIDIVLWAPAEGEDPEAGIGALLAARGDAPIVALISPGSEEVGVRAVEAGASDAAIYRDEARWLECDLPFLIENRLAASAAGSISANHVKTMRSEIAQLRSQREALMQKVSQLETMAWTDPLTGLANRRQIDERLPRMFAEAVRYEGDLACLVIDLDGFKSVNDELGHAEGDTLLRMAAQAVEDEVRASDIAARVGGDEFLVLMPQTDCESAAHVARRLLDAFAGVMRERLGERARAIGMSIGVACLSRDQPLDGQGLVESADRALYSAKRGGKNTIMSCSEGGFVRMPTHETDTKRIDPPSGT